MPLFSIKRSRLLKVILQLSCWIGIILFIVLLYSFRYEFINAKNRIKAELFPSSAIMQNDQIIINISQDNHYYIDLTINNEKIKFLVDTGASDLVLSKFDAKRIGIDFDRLNFNKIYQTANGQTKGASIILDNIEISGLLFKNIPASVNLSPMQHSLLGMRFLNNFRKYEFYQDRLILTLF